MLFRETGWRRPEKSGWRLLLASFFLRGIGTSRLSDRAIPDTTEKWLLFCCPLFGPFISIQTGLVFFFYSTLPSALDLIIKSLVLRRNPVSLESSVDMEILNIKRWDTLLEFRRDLRDAHYYQKVWRWFPVVNFPNLTFPVFFLYPSRLQIDRDGSGYIELSELKQALDVCGFKIPSFEVRRMIEEVDRDQSGSGKGRLSFDEFEHVSFKFKPCNSEWVQFSNGIFFLCW